MMLVFTGAFLGALFFAAAAYVGALVGDALCRRIPRFTDAPPAFNPPTPLLLIACAALGAYLTVHDAAVWRLLLSAALCSVLVGIWVTDAKRGIVPDVFTVVPLAGVLVWALVTHTWSVPLSALVPFVPFAGAAIVSHGRGMGWGDVKLVALGGALLGVQTAIAAFVAACFAAVIISLIKGRRRGAIVFGPYLATAIGAALPLAVLR